MSELVGRIHYEVDLDTRKMVDGQREVDRRTKAVEQSFNKMAAAVSAAISAIAIEGLISKVINAQRQFDVLFSSLKTVTGGTEQAGAAFDRLQKFAEKTPYSLDQAVNGFVKLKALGLAPSERAMTSFGNTASAMGKSLTQMIEAVADASTGEFERLKEFGIKAKTEGDKVALTFRGTTTSISNDANSIVEYLTKIGETDFAGAMAERMNTLDGNISNLEDSLTSLYRTISSAGVGEAVAAGVRKATEVIQQMGVSIKEGGLTEYFDGLKPYIAAAEVAVVSLAGAMTARLIAAFIATASQAYASVAALGAATVAARGFSAVMSTLGGPIGIAITGLALLAIEWGKVGGQARDAAGIAEEAATRIANALKKSQGRATTDLAQQLGEVRGEIKGIDDELANTKFPLADPKELDELRRRRAQLIGVASDIQAAMDKLHGGAGRGRVNPDVVVPDPSGGGGGGSKGSKFDSVGYLRSLEAQTLEGMARINAMEQEALRRNAALLQEGKITRAEAANAATTIERNAARERLDVQLQNVRAIDLAMEDAAKKETEARQRFEQDRKRAGAFAAGITAEGDPAEQIRVQYEARLVALQDSRAAELLTEQEYAAAVVANAEQMQLALAEIAQRRVDAEAAAQGLLLASASGFFGQSADLIKAHAGETSSAYRAAFAVSKGFAIAEGTIALYSAALKAMNDPTAITLPQKLANYAAVFAAGGALLSTIKGTQYGGGRQYGGPVTSGSLYRVNETGRPEMFTAANGSQYMLPTANGNVTPANQVGASGGWTINVHNAPPGTTAKVNDQARVIEIAVAAAESNFVDQVANNQGRMWSALAGSSNVQGRQ